MLLRSSSTPLLGSLLSSHSESPNNHHHSEINASKQRFSPISFHHDSSNHTKFGSFHLSNSCQSPISPTIADLPAQGLKTNGFRRAQSDGNLEGLLNSSTSYDGFDEFEKASPLPPLPKKFQHKEHCSKLETIQSFSDHNSLHLSDGDEECNDDGGEGGEKAEAMLKSASFGLEDIYAYVNRMADSAREEEGQRALSKMHMAMGLGVEDFSGYFGGNNGGGSGNGGKRRGSNNGDGGGGSKLEDHYKKMMEENPGDPIFMRNYAEFLHQTKNDLRGAEEYYSRAILADPRDGEVLSQYAKVIWSLHGDQDRAATYFERSIQAAPEDCQVLAAHANFLWETEEDDCKIEGGAMLMHENAMAASNG